jgi:hypothetical protein
MLVKKMAFFLMLSTILLSCGNKEGKAYARIIERKHVDSGKLQISYSFTNEGKLYNGNATINNMVLPNDSVLVMFPPENPASSKPQIP